MDREKLIRVIWEEVTIAAKPSRDIEGIKEAADRILALLDEERKGWANLGQFTGGMELDVFLRQAHSSRKPTKICTLVSAGRLVFIPEGER